MADLPIDPPLAICCARQCSALISLGGGGTLAQIRCLEGEHIGASRVD